MPQITTIVIPCYNEAQRLAPHAFIQAAAANPNLRFLFVNDGSRDGTLAMLTELATASGGAFGVLNLERNQGKAEAVRQGLQKAAQASVYVGFWDADLATPLDEIPRFLRVLEEMPELFLVLGSRVQLLGKDIDRKPIRHYLGRVFATAASIVLWLPVYDTQCGAKIMRVTPELTTVLGTPFLSRWIFDVEIFARYLKILAVPSSQAKCRFFEFPLRRWKDVQGSKVKPRDFFRAFFDLLRIHHFLRMK